MASQGTRPLVSTIGKYLQATMIGVGANLSLYLGLVTLGVYEPVANISAAALVIGPRFLLHKRWVWQHRTVDRIGIEATVHAGLTVIGLLLSTSVAWALAGRGPATLAVGNVSAFAATWLARFVVSHYYLFVDRAG